MWILVTLLATCFQIARTSEQHRLRGVLNVAEAGYVRFVYALPLAVTILTVWVLARGTLPTPNLRFFVSVALAGLAQILGTVSLLHSFRLRDFAVGTIYSKSEPLFIGVASALVLDEPLAPLAWVGVVICLAGVVWLTASGNLSDHRIDPAAIFGILAGLGFGLAAIGIRSGSSSLEGSVADRALFTLTLMLAFQTTVQGLVIARSSTSSLRSVAAAWRPASIVAVLSLGGSIGWAVAVTLENAARVRTLGQIEIVFAFALSVFVHHETHKRTDYLASGVVVAGLAILVLA